MPMTRITHDVVVMRHGMRDEEWENDTDGGDYNEGEGGCCS